MHLAHIQKTKKRIETIRRSGRRRLAALMDDQTLDGTSLASWEQYLCPPISRSTQLGDILKLHDSEDDDPSAFRLVLSPSCDLVETAKRKPKVKNVLVSKCCSSEKGLKRIGLEGTNSGFRDRIGRILSQGYYQVFVPIPKLMGKIPTMAADMRDLELIPVESVGEGKQYVRIASIDSPFKELVSWAYMQTAGRPGLPDRDIVSWVNEIMEDVED